MARSKAKAVRSAAHDMQDVTDTEEARDEAGEVADAIAEGVAAPAGTTDQAAETVAQPASPGVDTIEPDDDASEDDGGLLINKEDFAALVQQVKEQLDRGGLTIDPGAMNAFQRLVEHRMVRQFKLADALAKSEGRDVVTSEDMEAAGAMMKDEP